MAVGAGAASPAAGVPDAPRRVLVVEDEALIAMDLEAALQGAGHAVLGPFAGVEQGVAAAGAEPRPDAALLDVNLGGGALVFPVADALAARGVPFVFLTGYGPEILPERFRGRPTARKPCSARVVLALLSRALRR